ncbi:hypothetical protein D3C80_2217270 [compost metagenome]
MCRLPSITTRSGWAGVVSTLRACISPSMLITISVKVPPISVAHRIFLRGVGECMDYLS